jgi:Envelope integrity protein A
MMLVYNLDRCDLSAGFAGIDGSAYFIAGFGMTALGSGDIIVVPIRADEYSMAAGRRWKAARRRSNATCGDRLPLMKRTAPGRVP